MSQTPPETPSLIPDLQQMERLNTLWAIIDAPTTGGSPRSRLASVVRRLFGRVLSKQQEFNATLVDHINRNMLVFDHMGRAFGAFEAASDDVRRHRDALLARERRSEAVVQALVGANGELKAALGVLQQQVQQLKRELSQLQQTGVAPAATASTATAAPTTPAAPGVPPAVPSLAAPAASSQFAASDSHKYVGFEDHFRGATDDIAARQQAYVAIFADAQDVLDIGCGRGEFLEALGAQGIRARGIDLNPSMIDVCRAKGLSAETVDAVAYLRAQTDQSLGGLFCAQVVEHLEPSYLIQLLDLAYDKLRPGAPIVLETINPACWLAFFESYLRDITHVRALHPDTLKYLLVASGFEQVEIQYRAPYPEQDKLQPVSPSALGGTPQAHDLAETLNANTSKLNGLLFTYLDYAAIGRRR